MTSIDTRQHHLDALAGIQDAENLVTALREAVERTWAIAESVAERVNEQLAACTHVLDEVRSFNARQGADSTEHITPLTYNPADFVMQTLPPELRRLFNVGRLSPRASAEELARAAVQAQLL